MQPLRPVIAAILVIAMGITPGWGATGPAFGTVVAAEGANVGGGSLSAGTTVFGGDKLFTSGTGSVQVRAGAARLLLSSDTVAILAKDEISPAANLTRGTAVFSTATSKAFAMHVGSMVIRPGTDNPTVAQVTVVGPKAAYGEKHDAGPCQWRWTMMYALFRKAWLTASSWIRPKRNWLRLMRPGIKIRRAWAPGVAPGGHEERDETALSGLRSELTAIITALALSEALESPDRPNH